MTVLSWTYNPRTQRLTRRATLEIIATFRPTQGPQRARYRALVCGAEETHNALKQLVEALRFETQDKRTYLTSPVPVEEVLRRILDAQTILDAVAEEEAGEATREGRLMSTAYRLTRTAITKIEDGRDLETHTIHDAPRQFLIDYCCWNDAGGAYTDQEATLQLGRCLKTAHYRAIVREWALESPDLRPPGCGCPAPEEAPRRDGTTVYRSGCPIHGVKARPDLWPSEEPT
jgi:hypothetical protein